MNDEWQCACRGSAPQMREHTPTACSTVTTEELNAEIAAMIETGQLDPDNAAAERLPIPPLRRLT